MTAAELAKWSVVFLVCAGIAANIAVNLARPRTKIDGGVIVGVLIGLMLRAWVIIAICLWWQT